MTDTAQSATATELRRVELLQFPLQLYRLASEHHEDLMRELALIALHPVASGEHSVPSRLIALIEELDAQYAPAVSAADQQRDVALERGDVEIDLRYLVPAEARAASVRLGEMLGEAEKYCRSGEHLLTLATPPAAVAFRRWYLGQFVDQIDVAPPTPWPVYAQRHGGINR